MCGLRGLLPLRQHQQHRMFQLRRLCRIYATGNFWHEATGHLRLQEVGNLRLQAAEHYLKLQATGNVRLLESRYSHTSNRMQR